MISVYFIPNFLQLMQGDNKIYYNAHVILLDIARKLRIRTPEICPDFTSNSAHSLLTEMHPLCKTPTHKAIAILLSSSIPEFSHPFDAVPWKVCRQYPEFLQQALC